MEEHEKDTIFFMALAVSGAVLASALAAFLQWIIVLPLTVAVFLIMILTTMQYKKGAIHFSEKAESHITTFKPKSFHNDADNLCVCGNCRFNIVINVLELVH